MVRKKTDADVAVLPNWPRIEVPLFQPATPEEIERRRIVVERILRRRDRVGPIGIRADDLLHMAESEE